MLYSCKALVNCKQQQPQQQQNQSTTSPQLHQGQYNSSNTTSAAIIRDNYNHFEVVGHIASQTSIIKIL